MDIREIASCDVNWIGLAYDKEGLTVLLTTVIKLQVP
jgi:hypothetical protein